jgi:putative tricarboxylic transport membrane protein
LLNSAYAALLSASGVPAWGQARLKAPDTSQVTRAPLAPLPLLRIYIPGGAGGGWDQTGRALGAAMERAGLVQRIEYENKGGKGGTIGLDDFVARYSSDPAALLIGGMVMLGAIALSRPKTTLASVVPIARLTSDYMVIVVPSDSRIADVSTLAAEMQRDLSSVVFTGGSVGGVDHMLAGMMARQLKLDMAKLKYEPTSSGKEAEALLASGKAQVAISSFSEFKAGIADRTLRPLAMSSRGSLYGVRSLREQGIATEMANWRGVFGPGRISANQQEVLLRVVTQAAASPAWRESLLNNNWISALLVGKDFADTLETEQAMASAVTLMLKLKA